MASPGTQTHLPTIDFPLRPRAPQNAQERAQILARRSHQDLTTSAETQAKFAQSPLEEQRYTFLTGQPPFVAFDGSQRLAIQNGEIPRAFSPRFSLPKSPIATDTNQLPVKYEQRVLSPSSPLAVPTPNLFGSPSSPTVQLPRSPSEDTPPTILIGIDFGTTHSGVAWAYSKQPDDIKMITNWDSHEWGNSDKGKAPTTIAYCASSAESVVPKNSPNDSTNDTLWGYGIGEAESIKWFKLLLLDEEDMEYAQRTSDQIKKAVELLRCAGKTPVQAVADYLRLLWNHALANISKDFGKVAMDGSLFRVVLTVPAVWTTKAKDRMKKAAKLAGIIDSRLAGQTVLSFVSEPEAAALATFQDLKARPNFQAGDTFVVCDAGGGTVDLISYQVLQTSPLQVKECVEGSGRLCGAIFLDQDFESLMRQLIGDAWNVPESDKKELMNGQWENGIKRTFQGQDRKWKVILPHACTQRGAPPFVQLDKAFVSDIFDNVISQIRALVNDQISAVEKKTGGLPKAVVLVGGLGSCRHLFNELSEENNARNIEVQQSQGDKPWTTICRGAVLKALTNSQLPGVTVYSRISRHSYGMRHTTDFNPKIHGEEEGYPDPITGRHKVRNQMAWYLKRGDDIEETKPVKSNWHVHISADSCGPRYKLEQDIYLCGDLTPPRRFGTSSRPSCNIRAELDISEIPVITGIVDGKKYKRLNFEVEMTVIGTALEFALIFQGNRKNQSQVETEFEE